MANVLADDKKRMCIAALVEGNSIRSVERMTGVHRDTICRLLAVACSSAWARRAAT